MWLLICSVGTENALSDGFQNKNTEVKDKKGIQVHMMADFFHKGCFIQNALIHRRDFYFVILFYLSIVVQ